MLAGFTLKIRAITVLLAVFFFSEGEDLTIAPDKWRNVKGYKMKLTKRNIDTLQVEEKRTQYFDDDLKGFGIRVNPSGKKVFILFYRTLNGTSRTPVLGTYGSITVQQARDIARNMLHEVRNGGDPSADRKASKKKVTVSDICDTYKKEHVEKKKPHTQDQYNRLIDREIVPHLGTRRIDEITAADVSRLLSKVGSKHPVKANRLRAVLSNLFSLAERWGARPQGTNPVAHIDRYREKKRHRDLTAAELKRLADALETVKDETDNLAAITIIRLLLFTGARKSELLNLKWSEVDLERGMLRLGDSKTGQKPIYLNSAAQELLKGVTALEGCPYVFPAHYRPRQRKVGAMPEWELRAVWERVRELAGLGATDEHEAFRTHDLRHNFASLGAGAGLSLPQLGALLGHAQSRTTERYADLVNGPNVQAAELIGSQLTDAMKKAVSGEGIEHDA